MDDLISRRKAIDALCSRCAVARPETCSTIKDGDKWCEEVYTLLHLPSVQSKQKITVKNILELMEKDDMVIVTFYAYGIPYASTWKDDIGTVSECLDRVRNDCLNAKVFRIEKNGVEDNKTDRWIKIHAEIVDMRGEVDG